MDGLTVLGNILFFVIGTCFGAAIMYFGGLFIDWREDKKND